MLKMKGKKYVIYWIIIGLALLLPFAEIKIYPSVIPCLQFLLIVLAVMSIIRQFQGTPTEIIDEDKVYEVLKIIKGSEKKDYLLLKEYNSDREEPIYFETNKARLPDDLEEGASITLKENNFIMA